MAEPGLMMLGGERVILPVGRVPSETWPEFALAVLMEPRPSELDAWLGRLERSLGVKDEHRAAMERRAFAAVESAEAKRRRLIEQSRRAAMADAPPRDGALATKIAEVEARIAKAQAIEADPPGDTDRNRRRAAKQARAQVIDLTHKLAELRRKEADQARLLGDVADVVLRQRERGEEVVFREAKTAEFLRDEHGARVLERVRGKGIGQRTYLRPVVAYSTGLRAQNLTGPEHALHAGHLNGGPRPAEILMRTANAYREAYLIGEGAVSGRGDGGGGFGPKAPQPKRAEAGQDLADMRRGLRGAQLAVLDAICGKDMRVSEATKALGYGDARTTARVLRQGLAAARDSQASARAMRREKGEAGELQLRIAVGNAMIRGVRL
jgi:hypothetical protein